MGRFHSAEIVATDDGPATIICEWMDVFDEDLVILRAMVAGAVLFGGGCCPLVLEVFGLPPRPRPLRVRIVAGLVKQQRTAAAKGEATDWRRQVRDTG